MNGACHRDAISGCARRIDNARANGIEGIREHLDRLEWHRKPIEQIGPELAGDRIDRANMSDIFEYMSQDNARLLLLSLIDNAREGARFAGEFECCQHLIDPLLES